MTDHLPDLTPERVKSFLEASGWNKAADEVPGIAEQYIKDKNVVRLVVAAALPSYSAYLRDTIHSLSIFEGVPFDSLIRRIENVGAHRFSVTIAKGKPEHKIRLPDSVDLRKSVSEIVSASARSAISPSITHGRLTKTGPDDFLSECYEDQTERSSYVANFLIPKIKTQQLSGDLVVETIGKALATAKAVATNDMLPPPSAYSSLAKQGISSNLLKALAALKGVAASGDLIEFTLNNELPTAFSAPELGTLNELFTEIVASTRRVQTVVGEIIGTTLEPDCTMTMRSEVEGSTKLIKVSISHESYGKVIMAEHLLILQKLSLSDHRPKASVTGQLLFRSRGHLEMVDTTDFQIVTTTPPVS